LEIRLFQFDLLTPRRGSGDAVRRPNNGKPGSVARFAVKVGEINERVRLVFRRRFNQRTKISSASASVFDSGKFVGYLRPINFNDFVNRRITDN